MSDLKQKQDLLENFKNKFKQNNFDLVEIKKVLKSWYEIGRYFSEKSDLQKGFHKLIQKAFKKLSVEEYERKRIEFEIMMKCFHKKNKVKYLEKELLYVQRKIKKLNMEIYKIEKFDIANSNQKNNPLVENLKNKLNSLTKNLNFRKNQEQYLKNLKFIK